MHIRNCKFNCVARRRCIFLWPKRRMNTHFAICISFTNASVSCRFVAFCTWFIYYVGYVCCRNVDLCAADNRNESRLFECPAVLCVCFFLRSFSCSTRLHRRSMSLWVNGFFCYGVVDTLYSGCS